jgi:3-hydroxy-5-methyl-1-naphthoate 3-O-methyltransferase
LGKGQAVAIADRVDLTPVQTMLDIAGGSGIYSITFAQRQPTLRTTVFDLPPVLPFTQEIIAHHSMQERVTPCPGNYFQDDFTGGNDLVLLSNVLQTEAVGTCRMLLGKVFKALVPGGQLVIHGIMPHPDRVTPPEPALFPLQMLLSFPDGDAYPAEDICTWAAEIGFVDLQVTRLPVPAVSSLIMGRKPV